MEKIILMHQDGCPQCKMVELTLKKYNIEYESCKDTTLMIERGITHTPALIVDGQVLQGKPMMDWLNSHRG